CSPLPRAAPAPRWRSSRLLLLAPAPLPPLPALPLGLRRSLGGRRGGGGRPGVVPSQHREIRLHPGILRPALAAILPHRLRGAPGAGEVAREGDPGRG